ncbi:MAG: hypothetical protein EZS28_027631, partial [Streblomastix strix]
MHKHYHHNNTRNQQFNKAGAAEDGKPENLKALYKSDALNIIKKFSNSDQNDLFVWSKIILDIINSKDKVRDELIRMQTASSNEGHSNSASNILEDLIVDKKIQRSLLSTGFLQTVLTTLPSNDKQPIKQQTQQIEIHTPNYIINGLLSIVLKLSENKETIQELTVLIPSINEQKLNTDKDIRKKATLLLNRLQIGGESSSPEIKTELKIHESDQQTKQKEIEIAKQRGEEERLKELQRHEKTKQEKEQYEKEQRHQNDRNKDHYSHTHQFHNGEKYYQKDKEQENKTDFVLLPGWSSKEEERKKEMQRISSLLNTPCQSIQDLNNFFLNKLTLQGLFKSWKSKIDKKVKRKREQENIEGNKEQEEDNKYNNRKRRRLDEEDEDDDDGNKENQKENQNINIKEIEKQKQLRQTNEQKQIENKKEKIDTTKAAQKQEDIDNNEKDSDDQNDSQQIIAEQKALLSEQEQGQTQIDFDVEDEEDIFSQQLNEDIHIDEDNIDCSKMQAGKLRCILNFFVRGLEYQLKGFDGKIRMQRRALLGSPDWLKSRK